MSDILTALNTILEQRKSSAAESSYVASLYDQGLNKILEKIGEEATEVILAAKDLETLPSDAAQRALAGEVADLWFHSMVMLAHLDMNPDAVTDILKERFGLSGLEEKAARTGHNAPP